MYEVIIVGGGVAAFTAALFAARRGLKILVIGKDVAGQANFTDMIENFPGHDAVGGFELVSAIRGQAEKSGSEFLESEVTRVKAAPDSFVVTALGKQYKSQALILAFGKTPRDLGVPGENELKGRGVTYCANCDAPLYRKKIVAVVGVGDVAADAAILLSKHAKKVYVLTKSDKFTAHPALVKFLFKKKNVVLLPFTQVQELKGQERLTDMKILNLRSGHTAPLSVDGVFVELGYVVSSNFVKNVVKLDEQEQIIVNADQSTSHPGVFACGDVSNSVYKQAVISAGEAATAALSCYDWLQRKRGGVGLTSDWTQIKRVKS